MRAESRASRRIKKRWLTTYVVFLFVMSLSLLLIPYVANPMRTSRIPGIVVAGIMWISLFGTLITAAFITSRRRRDPDFRIRGRTVRYWGLIRFFRNGPALVADGGMLLSLVILILMLCGVIRMADTWFFALVGVFVYSFGMHCMLNGLNYIYIHQQRKKEGTSYEQQ